MCPPPPGMKIRMKITLFYSLLTTLYIFRFWVAMQLLTNIDADSKSLPFSTYLKMYSGQLFMTNLSGTSAFIVLLNCFVTHYIRERKENKILFKATIRVFT